MPIIKQGSARKGASFLLEILKNSDLTLKEKGFLTTLFILPEDIHFTLEGMEELSNDGSSSIKSTFNKLIAKGYIIQYSVRNKNGRYCRKDLILTIPDEDAVASGE